MSCQTLTIPRVALLAHFKFLSIDMVNCDDCPLDEELIIDSLEEILKAANHCNGSKAPGPDGYDFVRKILNLMKGDVIRFMGCSIRTRNKFSYGIRKVDCPQYLEQ